MTGTQVDASTGATGTAPRRYFIDAAGRRVLIGLTPEETFEFERLDSTQADAGERRRIELYEKHESAWKAWIAQNRIECRESFKLY